MPRTILIVEDNKDLANLLKSHLEELSYAVDLAHSGLTGREMADRKTYDLVVLDLMLPGLDGLELCRHLQGRTPRPAILMLTARSSEIDRVLGLELGADDYVTKPFSMRELLARIKAIFRRLEGTPPGAEVESTAPIWAGDLAIDPVKRRVTVGGRAVDLTPKEYDLLLLLARNPGRVYTRSQLLSRVWGYGYDGYQHTVNSHINRLRSKIEADPAHPAYVLTVWGVGYKFSEEAERP